MAEPLGPRPLGYTQNRLRRAHLEQPPSLRSHFALALEQCWQAFLREVAYLLPSIVVHPRLLFVHSMLMLMLMPMLTMDVGGKS